MTKQEEIAKFIDTYGELGSSVVAGMILDYLHSQGVVIRVPGNIAILDWSPEERKFFLDLLELGYSCVEPLIE